MPNSNRTDEPRTPPRRDPQERVASIQRWVAYIEANDPEVWGPQLNRLVDSQLESARQSAVPLEVRQRVDEVDVD